MLVYQAWKMKEKTAPYTSHVTEMMVKEYFVQGKLIFGTFPKITEMWEMISSHPNDDGNISQVRHLEKPI